MHEANVSTVRDARRDRRLDGCTPRIGSEALFNGRQVVILVHEGQDYVLRITRNGKLILTK